MVTVAHADGRVAPVIQLTAPGRRDILVIGGEPASATATISHPDSPGAFTVTFEAVRGAGVDVVVLATDQPLTNNTATIEIDAGELSPAASWRIRATATDSYTTRTVWSQPFIVSDTSTTQTWATVAPLFERHCTRCHQGKEIPDLAYDWSVYANSPTATGVFFMRGEIYRRVVLEQTMPPRSARTLFTDTHSDMTQQERALLAEWLLAGAPE
jgi:hypothetical protein